MPSVDAARAAAAAYAGFQPAPGAPPRGPAGDLSRFRKIANQVTYTTFELTVAAAVCAIAAVGTGDLLNLNIISFAEFILADAIPAYQFGKKETKTIVNPLIALGSRYYPDSVDLASPATIRYLKSRPLKSISGNLFSTAGLLISPHTFGANVMGGVKHGASTATTLAHMGMLAKIGQHFSDDAKTREWIRCCEFMKSRKAITRGAWTASNTVPGAGLIGTIIAMAAPLGGDLINQFYCHAVAAELHYAAKGGGGMRGHRQRVSARAIIEELLTKRGLSIVFGKYEVDRIIREPAGWMVIANKLTMV